MRAPLLLALLAMLAPASLASAMFGRIPAAKITASASSTRPSAAASWRNRDAFGLMAQLRLLAWNIRQGGGSRLPAIVEALARHEADVLVLSEYRGGDSALRLCEALVRKLAKQ